MKKPAIEPTADPTVIFTPLVIDGETYNLAWNWGAMAQAEKDLGEWVEDRDEKGRVLRRRFTRYNLLVGMAMVMAGEPSISDTGALLYGALKFAHPGINMAQVGKLCRMDTFADIRQALVGSWMASIPEASKRDPIEGGAASA